MRLALSRLNIFANPIAIKELRQTVKSKSGLAQLNLFLLVIIAAFALVYFNLDPMEENAGVRIYAVIAQILAIVASFIIPFTIYVRTGVERDPNDMDLLYITSMSPRTIILGKYAAGVINVLQLFSVTVPFICITYLLKGVDIAGISLNLISMFFRAVINIQIAVLLGSIAVQRRTRFSFGLLFAILIFIPFLSNIFSTRMYGIYSGASGTASGMSALAMWFIFALPFMLMQLYFIILMYLLSVAILKPAVSNRSYAPRFYITIFWLITMVAVLVFHILEDIWLLLHTFIGFLSLLYSISDRDIPAMRLRRTIKFPPTAYLFAGGSSSGILWSLIIMFGTLGYFLLGLYENTGRRNLGFEIDRRFISSYASMFISLSAYALLAFYLTRRLRLRMSLSKTWVIAVFFLAFMSIAVTIIHEAFITLPMDVLFISPFTAMISGRAVTAVSTTALCWFAFTFIISLKYIIKPIKYYARVKMDPQVVKETITEQALETQVIETVN